MYSYFFMFWNYDVIFKEWHFICFRTVFSVSSSSAHNVSILCLRGSDLIRGISSQNVSARNSITDTMLSFSSKTRSEIAFQQQCSVWFHLDAPRLGFVLCRFTFLLQVVLNTRRYYPTSYFGCLFSLTYKPF